VTALLPEALCPAATPTIVAIIKNKHIKARAFQRTERRNITTASFLMLQPTVSWGAAHGQQTGVRSRRLAATIEIVRQLLSETPAQQICTRTHRA